MKKPIFILSTLLLIPLFIYSQDCLPEGIVFTSQTEIDNFQIDYPGCYEILGSVEINGDQITNLSGLYELESIGGSLVVQFCENLLNFTGLENLKSVGGDFRIFHSDGLNNFTGLNSLETIGGSFDIWNNSNLVNIDHCNNLSFIGGDLQIYYNDALLNVLDFDELTSIGARLIIEENESLINLDGFLHLTEIGQSLIVNSNANLPFLDGFVNLTTINGSIEIVENNNLLNLNGLANVQVSTITGLNISYNSALGTCHAGSICNYLSSPNGPINIFNNGEGCDNISEVANACEIDLSCLPYGNYILTDQSMIDDFQTIFPDCNDLNGILVIRGDDIENLDGLTQITSVEEDLVVINTELLANLSGLTNLSSLGGSLAIQNNNALTDITHLQGLNSISGDVFIYENNNLLTLSGLENIPGNSVSNLYIIDNALLSLCAVHSVCDYLANPSGDADIHGNSTGCDSKNEILAVCDTLSVSETDWINSFRILPNPVESISIIEFFSTQHARVYIQIFNLHGLMVREIPSKLYQPGKQQVEFNAAVLLSGIYFCVLKTNEGIQIEKFVKQ